MSKLIFPLLFILYVTTVAGQSTTKIYTTDIDNFWIAYDSVVKIKYTTIQKQIIQTLYLDKATRGLKDFIILREHSASRQLKNIRRLPKFWPSLRPHTLKIESYKVEIQTIMDRFRKIYPGFDQPDIYFTIGCLNSGGTTESDRILIGAEIAAADSTVDASELGSWLQNVFKDQKSLVYLVTHESVHTQQKGDNSGINLLTACVAEGSADFITELLMEQPVSSPYMTYGAANEKELWIKFEKEKFSTDYSQWLYNGSQVKQADLGYFMGYAICRSYYTNAKNKQKAIAEILALKYGDKKMLETFLNQSGYAKKWQ